MVSCSNETSNEYFENKIKIENAKAFVSQNQADSLNLSGIKSLDEEADKLISHINLIKAKLYSVTVFGEDSFISEEVYKNGVFLIGLDSVKVLSGIADSEVTTKLMVGDNMHQPITNTPQFKVNYSAVYLRNTLAEFKNNALELCRDLELSDSLKTVITNRFYFKLKSDILDKEEEWTVRNFYKVPLAAVAAKLSGLQTEVKRTVLEVAEEMLAE